MAKSFFREPFQQLQQTLPERSDPRWAFACILMSYVVIGTTWLGFNRAPEQILMTVGSAVALDLLLQKIIKGRLVFPLSAFISGLGLTVILNYAQGSWLPLVPVFLSITSKYVFTFRGKHVFNPTLFGIVASLFLADGFISPAPAYQWGGSLAASLFVVTLALFFFVRKIQRGTLIASFLFFYAIAAGLRGLLMSSVMPPEAIILGALSSPAFYLFTFFMITDPATSPSSPRAQVAAAFSIVFLDFVFHYHMLLETNFYAAFTFAAGRFTWLHLNQLKDSQLRTFQHFGFGLARVASFAFAYLLLHFVVVNVSTAGPSQDYGFQLKKVDPGVTSRPSQLTNEVDPRVRHVGKWLLSIGDAAAVHDFDQDGYMDIFLSQPLKAPEDRAALYRNIGGFRFARVPLPALEPMRRDPKANGLVTGGLWFDYDNDGDQDLLALVTYGRSRLLKNLLKESGRASFVDVSQRVGLTDFTNSVAANVLDFDRDGSLDLIIGHSFTTDLPDYDPPENFNAFDLPQPRYDGDRRMFNVMNRTWHDANNGGGVFFYRNSGNGFIRMPNEAYGFFNKRWVLAIGTGDLDNDGWTDLYLANDFGPDQLLINEKGQRFNEHRGRIVGQIGRDTYKGMNSTFADFDNDGFEDIYVSNMHHELQAEGSLLWMNDGSVRSNGVDAFHNRAASLNALNEKRFGWGATAGDLNLDGRLDIIQSNGYLDDKYDQKKSHCEDYWYWNGIIALGPPDLHGYADNWADLEGRCMFADEKNRIYLNFERKFLDVADAVGASESNTARAVAVADFDNDGDLDIVITRMTDAPVFYQNVPTRLHSWIGLELKGGGLKCNRDGIGSRVVIEDFVDGTKLTQYREVKASNGLSSQNDPRLIFGLGESKSRRVRALIYWCGETQAQEFQLETNSYHLIRQGQ